MPTKLTPQGWVKTAPAPRKKQAIQNPKAAFRGPLAYLACQPQAPALNVGGNTAGVKGKAPFPYDLSASPEKLRRLGQEAGRTVSAPVMRGGLHVDDDDLVADAEVERGLAPSKSETHSKHKSRASGSASRHHGDDHHHHRHHHRDHDNHSVASSTSSGSSSSSRSSGAPSNRSYTRHRPPVETRPQPAPAHHYYPPAPAGPRYDQYMAPPPVVHMPGHMHMPMPPSSGRSLSYSWYNATTPLNI